MSLNYVTEERRVIPARVLSDPYVRAEIEQIDHNYTKYIAFNSWGRDNPITYKKWNGYYCVQIKNLSTPSLTLNNDINIGAEGWYRIMIRMIRSPNYEGKYLNLYMGTGTSKIRIDKPVSGYYPEHHWKLVDFGLVYLNAGKVHFELDIDSPISVGHMFLYKVNKHDSVNMHDYSKKLDIQTLQFTQNSVAELNNIEMVTALKDSYYDEDSPSRFIFDGYTNSISVFMGEDNRSAAPMFGGYITGITDSYSEDSGYTMTIKGADRLLDFYREPLYVNMEINTKVKADDSKIFPYVYKHNVPETIRYIAETAEEGIKTNGVESPYSFYLNFASKKEFANLQVTGYTKQRDLKNGNPKPGLRLGVGKRTGSASLTIFDRPEDPFDANIDNILSFHYMYSPHTAKYPTQFHFAIDMFKDGEDISNVVTYYVTFNSKTGHKNIIGSIKPVYNGKWQCGKIDLRAAFDSFAPSSEYNITGIRLVDTLNATQVKNRLHSAIWLDNITVYDESKNLKALIDSEGSYPFEYFQKICDATDYSLWVDYGAERRDDVLVLASNYDDVGEIQALPSNIISIGDIEYDMYEYNVRNFARRIYHPTVKTKKQVAHILKNKPSKKKYKVVYVKTKSGKSVKRYEYFTYKDEKVKLNRSDSDMLKSSFMRYRRWEDFKDLTDTTKKVDAQTDAQTFLNSQNEAPYSFTLTMRGTTLLKPNQYLFVEEDKRRLTGLHKIASITHNYDATGNSSEKWQTQIDLGLPSRRFRQLLRNMKRDINRLDGKSRNVTFTVLQSESLGDTSPGAFL